MERIEEKLKQLPPDLRKEVTDLIDSLLSKQASRRKKKPTVEWIGGLKECRDQYTSVELQKKASEWRD